MLLVNTFDVEPWWATVPPCIGIDHWNIMPERSEGPLHEYLDLCDLAGVKCTFFFVGWYASRYPGRIAEVIRRGHEAGCHSLFHEDVATLTIQEFRNTTREAKERIEDSAGTEVIAYRAPSFSFPPARCAEFMGELSVMGFQIDSSITTAGRMHGGGYSKQQFSSPGSLLDSFGIDMFEVPVPGVAIAGRELQVFGGGYLRLTPSFLLNQLIRRESYQVLYLHPHDFDPDLPTLPNSTSLSNMRRRIQVGSLENKVKMLFDQCEVRSCGELFARSKLDEQPIKVGDATK